MEKVEIAVKLPTKKLSLPQEKEYFWPGPNPAVESGWEASDALYYSSEAQQIIKAGPGGNRENKSGAIFFYTRDSWNIDHKAENIASFKKELSKGKSRERKGKALNQICAVIKT